METSEFYVLTETKLKRIACLSKQDLSKEFTCLMHLFNEESLLNCYHSLNGKKAVGIIRALQNHLYNNTARTVIDRDLKNFFGTINHQLLEEILKKKVKDPRFMRYINRMFKAGVLSDGDMKRNDEGVPQGSICSPILSNIFTHEALDLWIKEMVKPCCKGNVEIFRYADDAVICCESETEAVRIRNTLTKGLAKFKLRLKEESNSSDTPPSSGHLIEKM